MPELFVEKLIEINAPASLVWEVLTSPPLSKQWIEQFWPAFITLECDWKAGSPMLWKSADGNIDGQIIAIEPTRLLRYSFTMPQDIVTIILDEGAEGTLLSVTHGDFADKPDGEECYCGALAGWEMNLSNIKELAENRSCKSVTCGA